ncbi:MAG: hypothetical protein ACTSRX_06060 [Promethearchaeota archaeon]
MTIKIASFIKTEFGKSEFFSEELQKISDITKILSISGEYEFLIEIVTEKSDGKKNFKSSIWSVNYNGSNIIVYEGGIGKSFTSS